MKSNLTDSVLELLNLSLNFIDSQPSDTFESVITSRVLNYLTHTKDGNNINLKLSHCLGSLDIRGEFSSIISTILSDILFTESHVLMSKDFERIEQTFKDLKKLNISISKCKDLNLNMYQIDNELVRNLKRIEEAYFSFQEIKTNSPELFLDPKVGQGRKPNWYIYTFCEDVILKFEKLNMNFTYAELSELCCYVFDYENINAESVKNQMSLRRGKLKK